MSNRKYSTRLLKKYKFEHEKHMSYIYSPYIPMIVINNLTQESINYNIKNSMGISIYDDPQCHY